MTLSIHFVVDNCPQDRLERGLLYLKRTKQRSVDIAAGAQLDRGMQFVERVRAELPAIEILWRNLDPDDTGMHTKMSAAENYQRKVSKHLAWFQRNRIVYMPDNESGGDDQHIKTKYVPWLVEHLVMLHTDNLRGAVLRSSTGTFPEHQYPLFKPVFNAMLPGDYISPNEYSAQPGYPKGSGGHLARYENFWIAAGRKLPTIIGEAGIAMNYDPGKGYIDAGMSDEAMAQQLLDEEVWYENGAIDRHVYLLGGFSHEGYRLRDGVLDYWERYYASHQPPVVVIPTPVPAPPPPPESWATGVVQTGIDGVFIRLRPDTTSPKLDILKNNDIIQYDRNGVVDGWLRVKKGDKAGYASAAFFSIVMGELPAENNEPPLPLPEPSSPNEIKLARAGALWIEKHNLEARIAAIVAELDTLLAA